MRTDQVSATANPSSLSPAERAQLHVAMALAALAAITVPVPPHAWLVVLASAAVPLRWWGVLRGQCAFVLPWTRERGRAELAVREGVPWAGPVQLNPAALVEALRLLGVQSDDAPLVNDTVARLSAALNATPSGAWVELRGVTEPPLVVQREALARVLTAATMVTTPAGDEVDVRVVEVDLAVPGSPARTVVFDGRTWVGFVTEVLGTELADRVPMELVAQGGA